MKLIALMGLQEQKNEIRKVFEQRDVQIYSEVEITGHTSETIRRHGWWVFEGSDFPLYSTMYFAIVSAEKSEEIMHHIERLQADTQAEHPPRAFQVNVEKMI